MADDEFRVIVLIVNDGLPGKLFVVFSGAECFGCYKGLFVFVKQGKFFIDCLGSDGFVGNDCIHAFLDGKETCQ